MPSLEELFRERILVLDGSMGVLVHRKGLTEADMAWADDVFDHGRLTIGFARRFAAYKRATLLLSQPDRLAALLLSSERPVQLVFAGKAHPADQAGKAVIALLVQTIRQWPDAIVFLENYDMGLGRLLTRGCDVWLNTPRRPLEASGTSGMKAAMNGALNCSILDGWWPEGCEHGVTGWAIGDEREGGDQDSRDLAALYDMSASEHALESANVRGTWHAVQLANAVGAGRFHHVSSIAAAGRSPGVFREDMFSEATGLGDPYFRTKHASEAVVRSDCRVPWRIYRPGIVVGHSVSGEMDKVDGPYYFFPLLQRMAAALPGGVFVRLPEGRPGPAYLLENDRLLPWSPAGYGEPRAILRSRDVEVLTPRSIVAVLSAGYRPMLHPSAHARQGRA